VSRGPAGAGQAADPTGATARRKRSERDRAAILDALRSTDDATLRRALGGAGVRLPAYATSPDFDRPDFIQLALAAAWPHVTAAAADEVVRTVNPLLMQQKPGERDGVVWGW
jgi:hypothetical protein